MKLFWILDFGFWIGGRSVKPGQSEATARVGAPCIHARLQSKIQNPKSKIWRISVLVLWLLIELHGAASAQPSGDRLAAIEQSLEARRQLIASKPNDPQRGVWLADQASELFFDSLSHEGLGLTALFGLPSVEDRSRAAAAAKEMHDCAAAADNAIRKSIADLDAAPGIAGDAAMQQQRRELTETQRDRRIPFLQGVAAFLHAEWNTSDPSQRRSLYDQADSLLSKVAAMLEGSTAREARLYAGLAKARRGDFDGAEMHFTAVAKDSASTPAQVFTARMGGVINRTQRGGSNPGLEALNSIESRYTEPAGGSAEVFFRVLVIDHRCLLRRDEDLTLALTAYTDLLKSETRVTRDVLRSIVLSKLADATADLEDSEFSVLPGMAIVARADRMSRDESTRAKAVLLLEASLGSERLDSEARAAALFVLGRALYEHGQRLLAAQRFIELAANHPTDFQAQRAIELGVTITGDLHRAVPTDNECRALYREGLNLLLLRYANLPTIDRWRYAAGVLALEESRFDDAAAHFGHITPDAAEWVDSHFMQAAVARGRALSSSTADADRRRFHEQTLATIERVQPMIAQGRQQQSDPKRAATLNDSLGLLRVYRAEAQLHLSQPHLALQTLQGMESEPFGAAVISEALKVRIDAYQAMRQPEDAMRELDRFVQTSPEQAGAVLLPMLGSIQRDVEALIDAGDEDGARNTAVRTFLPTAQLLERWLDSQRTADAAAVAGRTRIAHAYLFGGKFTESLARFESLLAAQSDQAELLLGKAESLFGLGSEEQLAGAMAIYKRLAAAGGSTDQSVSNRTLFWLSQWRMLQIIDRVNRHTEQILPRIERLRQQNATFGGERYRRGFDSLRMKYSSNR